METRILITDLTAMQGDRVCIAGVNEDFQNIRPVLPYPGISLGHVFHRGRVTIRPRAVVRLQLDPSGTIERPHVEDYDWQEPWSLRSMEKLLEDVHWQGILESLAANSPQPLFGAGMDSHKGAENRKLQGNQAECSLTTIAVNQTFYFLCEQDGFKKDKYKYRMSFTDDRENFYDDIPITDLALRSWAVAQLRQGKTPQSLSDWLTGQLQNAQQVYLRLGLTREYRREYWLQVNGIYSFPDWLGGRCFADFDAAPG